jgi:hypothetical protein
VDQDGRPISLARYQGKAVALTFIYTRCPLPDFCPLMNSNFLKLDALRIVPNPKAKDKNEQPPMIAEFEVSTFVLGGALPAQAIPAPSGDRGAVGAFAAVAGSNARKIQHRCQGQKRSHRNRQK